MLQPLAIANANAPTTTPPSYITKIAPIATIEATTLVEQPEVADIPVAAPVVVTAPLDASYSGTGDYYLDWIVAHESGGNPYAMNSIGACGLFQALPCSKMGCNLSDVPCQIAWGKSYVDSAYGGSYNAYLHWLQFSWY